MYIAASIVLEHQRVCIGLCSGSIGSTTAIGTAWNIWVLLVLVLVDWTKEERKRQAADSCPNYNAQDPETIKGDSKAEYTRWEIWNTNPSARGPIGQSGGAEAKSDTFGLNQSLWNTLLLRRWYWLPDTGAEESMSITGTDLCLGARRRSRQRERGEAIQVLICWLW